ncbi:hypothetical protein PHMEG_00017814 [Phytophthora megakarya]|uniref:Uncharacterized protein n=1 Tax=Phytophthora megakarya TaxID=4795 RepID=A0A225VX51_9STRA|nr:hypothetical protein PHMEG_00017814 [Phytophthora megakarya]
MKAGGGIPIWSRSPRFPGRRQEHYHQTATPRSPVIDYISRNKEKIENMSVEQSQRRRMQQAVAKTKLKVKTTVSEAWGTLIVLSVAQTKLVKLLVISVVLRRLRQALERRYKHITFESWTHVRDRDAMRSLAAALITRRSFRFRLSLRVERKTRAAKLLRTFLSGLTFDVRFAMAVRRMQRRIICLQRWWRRARLVVRAREQCLAYKWMIIEKKLRAEAIAQMLHLQRVFQPPTTAAPFIHSGSSNVLTKRRSSVVSAAPKPVAVESQLPLHKLLNLPEQKRWFNARFVLTPDGVLRGYSTLEQDADTGAESTPGECLMVEVKHFRCHAHGFANVPLGSSGEDGENDTRPYLMIFRPGASRFVLITDTTSLILSPLLDWKEKLERIGGHPTGSPFSGGSQRDIQDILTQSDISGLDDTNEEPEVQISNFRRGSTGGGSNGDRSPSTPQRKRSSFHRLRRSTAFQPIAEGEMSYYVVDLLRDCPRVPPRTVWSTLRDKLREERKNFRSDIYRFMLESTRYEQHERDRRQIIVLDKFKEFFTMERPRHPHFRSLISHRKMEALVRQTIEFVRTTQPSNPKFML